MSKTQNTTNPFIEVRGASEHNLRHLDLQLPKNKLIVFTGVSGSGKSSLAFDTIYAEGQRRYIESLSSYARQFLGQIEKPEVKSITGLSPSISIDQKSVANNPRSTVATITDIYDYMRVLYTNVGKCHCPECGNPLTSQTADQIIDQIMSLPEGTRFLILAPIVRGRRGRHRRELDDAFRAGYVRARINGKIHELGQEIIVDTRQRNNIEIVADRLVRKADIRTRLANSVNAALKMGTGNLILSVVDGSQQSTEDIFFSKNLTCSACQISIEPPTPKDFSFNSPSGMCPTCNGLGTIETVQPDLVVPDDSLSISGGAVLPWKKLERDSDRFLAHSLADYYQFSLDQPWSELTDDHRSIVLHGTQGEKIPIIYRWYRSRRHKRRRPYDGVLADLATEIIYAQEQGNQKWLQSAKKYLASASCPDCNGKRIKRSVQAVTIDNRSIVDITEITINDCLHFFESLILTDKQELIAGELLKEIKGRLGFLVNVGLGYLSLNRKAQTLSGGESQRIRLASQIGAGLQNVIYVLDEPSIGLHPRDNNHLLSTLNELRDQGNTVIVVEHDEDTMWNADLLVDFGPGAGVKGGEIVAMGTPIQVAKTTQSLTAKYLRQELKIPIPQERRKAKVNDQGQPLNIQIRGATQNNLKNISVKIPIGTFTCVTGVSGSGKSSLVNDILHPVLSRDLMRAEAVPGDHKDVRIVAGDEFVPELQSVVDKVIAIDQTPIGRIPRSNPATYTKLFDHIRTFYAEISESKLRGYKPGRFSFNVKGGRCEACEGNGAKKIELQFLADVWVKCNICNGARYNQETLSVKYKNKSIAEVLEMDVQEALQHFRAIPKIAKILQTLQDVGMEYIKLGQPSPTLSGGEAQRIKLARELSKRSTGKTLYILDEPTTGLHFDDIQKLLLSLHKLVESGNTVVVIEHNLDVIKTADHIIDLGPEGGENGGQVVAMGTPEKITESDISYTGQALKDFFSRTKILANTKYLDQLASQLQLESTRRVDFTADSHIRVSSASEHNLKEITVNIPHGKLTTFTGVSGSGKSSLALDTIYAEGQRRYVESLSSYARQFLGQVNKPKVERIEGLSPAIAIERKDQNRNPRSTVGTITEIYDYLRVLYARIGEAHCFHCHQPVQAKTIQEIVESIELMPNRSRIHILSPLNLLDLFPDHNSEEICKKLLREGYARIEVNQKIYSLDQAPLDLISSSKTINLVIDRMVLDRKHLEKSRLAEAVEVAISKSMGSLTVRIEPESSSEKPNYQSFTTQFVCLSCDISFPELAPQQFSFNSSVGQCPTCTGLGVIGRSTSPCPECEGTRLQPFFRHVTVDSLTLPELTNLSIDSANQFFQQLELNEYHQEVAGELLIEIKKRFQFLDDIGLHYLTLNNIAPTLSGGELQRIQLANQLGSGLTGVTYILDEPTIGLHQRDNQRLINAMKRLRDLGNSILVVEHDTSTINQSDHLIEFGPGAGYQGGRIVAQGTPHEIQNNPDSQTGRYLSDNKLSQLLPDRNKVKVNLGDPEQCTIDLIGVNTNNLKDINVSIPVGALTCVTGVSGCGKSSLIEHTLFPIVSAHINHSRIPEHTLARKVQGIENINTIINIDQAPIGESPRSNLATYTDIFTKIRNLFSSLDSAQTRGYNSLRFSFNMTVGQCEACLGLGYNQVEMYFLPDVWVKCDTCDGTGYHRETLEIRYKGKNIAEVLRMTVDEACDFFSDQSNILNPLQIVRDVGLGYMQLGQPSTTLSSGEAQRIKLSSELVRRSRGHTLYLMDEPTTGLHPADVSQLMKVINELVKKDNTVVIIEHNLDVIRCADWVIDIGPEGGKGGGELLAFGPPEEVAQTEVSHTGKFLKPFYFC